MKHTPSNNTLSKEGLYSEIGVGVTFASLMSATSLFFTGIIIGQYKSFDTSIRVPLIFLIISTFSFIFAATIFSNAANEVTLNKTRLVEKYMIYARNIQEFLGLYLFMLATPMVIGAVTHDSFLRTTTIIIGLTGIALYSQSKFSMLEKQFAILAKRLLTIVILALSLALYIEQSLAVKHGSQLYLETAVALLLLMIGTTIYFTLHSNQYKTIIISEFIAEDASILSKIIQKDVDHYRSARYSQQAIEAIRKISSPDALIDLSNKEQIFVARFDGKAVGCLCLQDTDISNVFTDPNLHKKGVGRALVDYAETVASEAGFTYTQVLANKVDNGFYTKLGYEEVKRMTGEHGNEVITMKKSI